METEQPAQDLAGPMSMLTACTEENCQVIINCRNNRKLLGRIKAFDRHMNLILENAHEYWTETRNGHSENKERFISKLFLRGDSVVIILRAPKD
jgi:small nuclear ribonucleoprotein D2